jgi:hypothetical protein
VLRTFEDRFVAALPSEATLEAIALLHPAIRVELHGSLDSRLSDEMRDGHSYRYGIINLGGHDRTEVLQKFEDCRRRLGIRLLPIRSVPSDAGPPPDPKDVETRALQAVGPECLRRENTRRKG